MAHIASLKLLNKERWEAQVKQQQETGNHLFNRANPFSQGSDGKNAGYVQPYVRTKHPDRDGRRLDPLRGRVEYVGPDGKFLHGEERQLARNRPDEQKNQLGYDKNKLKYVPVYGHDALSERPSSRYKYRIPHDSVVNKVGDCKLFFCCGWRLTAAQWSAPPPLPHGRVATRARASPG
jgi:hypothetical protein